MYKYVCINEILLYCNGITFLITVSITLFLVAFHIILIDPTVYNRYY